MVPLWQQHWFSAMVALDGTVIQRVAGMTLVFNPHVEGPLQNFVLWREVSEDPVAQLRRAEEACAAVGRAPAFWPTPEVEAQVAPLLGVQYQVQNLAVLWRPLVDLPPQPVWPADVSLRAISPAGVKRWVATLVACFGWTPLWQRNLVDAYGAALAQGGSGYLLQRRSKAIGCGWLQVTDSVAGLYGGGVLPGERGRGFGRSLILHRLHAAWAQGAAEATLQVEPGAVMERICLELGFERVAMASVWHR